MLKDIAIKNRALGAVYVGRPVEEIVTVAIVTVDHASENSYFNTFDIEVSRTDDTAEIVAIRAVEAVRVAIVDSVEVVPEPEDPRKNVSVRVDSKLPKKERRNLRLFATFSGEYSPGGTGFMGGPDIGVTWLFLKWLSFGFDAANLPIGSDIQEKDDSASFDMTLGRLRISYERFIVKRLKAAAGISVGIGYIMTRGRSEKEAVTLRNDRTVLAYVGGIGEFGLVITERVWLPLTVNIGALPPGVTIIFDDEKVAKVGMPIIEFGMGVAVSLDVESR